MFVFRLEYRCDRCDVEADLVVKPGTLGEVIPMPDGWRESRVTGNPPRHLCPECYADLVAWGHELRDPLDVPEGIDVDGQRPLDAAVRSDRRSAEWLAQQEGPR